MRKPSSWHLISLTTIVMVAFALNSVLCREALTSGAIGAADFTFARLLSGALVLLLLVTWQSGWRAIAGDWISATALFVYAASFSYAYINLSAGTGALLLFGTVQLGMISWGVWCGERLSLWQWIGVSAAFAGLIWFISPQIEAPPLFAAILMMLSGLSWAIYSLRGRGIENATAATAGNFMRSIPMAILLLLFSANHGAQTAWNGWALAVASGALASGLGYALWYAVLPKLSAATAATVQLSVPVLAALGGSLFLAEALSTRLSIATAIILGGILVFIHSARHVKR